MQTPHNQAPDWESDTQSSCCEAPVLTFTILMEKFNHINKYNHEGAFAKLGLNRKLFMGCLYDVTTWNQSRSVGTQRKW